MGKPVRDFYLGSEGEGCEVDDATGALYISEEDVGIWRYDLTAPAGPVPPRVLFASAGPLLAPDIEGLAPPTWDEVVRRHYVPWSEPHWIIDTAVMSAEEAVQAIGARMTGKELIAGRASAEGQQALAGGQA